MKKKNRLPRVLIILFVGGLLVAAYVIIYGKFTGSISSEHYESLKNTYNLEVEKLTKLNRQLNKQLAQIRERLEETTKERNSLENDKSQLLFMLEKLEQRVTPRHP